MLPCNWSWNLLPPHHFDTYLGFVILIDSMPFYKDCTPRLIVCIADWTMRVSVQSWVVFLVVILIAQAAFQSCLYCKLCCITLPCFWAVVHLCIMIGWCRFIVPCLWAVLCLCVLDAWSHDLGFLHELNWPLITFTKNMGVWYITFWLVAISRMPSEWFIRK